MTPFEAIILGIVQGLTEFLPISSSAHLILVPWVFQWETPGLAFDVALHWGTLLGVCLYFRNDIWQLFRQGTQSLISWNFKESPLPWLLILATIPGAVIGFLFEDIIEHQLRSPWIIMATLALLALLLFTADRTGSKSKSIDSLTWPMALALGLAQSLALIPGVSRSGITMTTALFLGLHRPSAVRFSFLMAIPIVLGAGLLKIPAMIPYLSSLPFWLGMIASAVSGITAIHFLLNYVKSNSFTPFVIYRLGLSLFVLIWILKT